MTYLYTEIGSFHIEEHEKAALVGINGAGKTTIFKMIVGELPLDAGNVVITKGKVQKISVMGYNKNRSRII